MRWWGALAVGALISGGMARAADIAAPKNVNAEPSTPRSAELSTRSATAEMSGNPSYSLKLADDAIRADPKDPWPYYDKGMALARVGELDGALAALDAAEQHFAASDRWGRSVAVFGRAHALSEAGRCVEAEKEYDRYASLIPEDAGSVAIAHRYAADCQQAPTTPASAPIPAE